MSATFFGAAAFAREQARWMALVELSALLAVLGAMTLLRAQINGSSAASAFVSGALFGLGLLALALVASPGLVRERPSVHSVAIGLAGGAALIAVPLIVRPVALAGGTGPEPFALWVAVTCLVAAGEEAMLRGALFDRATAVAGIVPAVVLTSVVFALMHVPLYGWAVLPIDLGAGLALCGLRLISGGVAAPAIAHAAADIATWWL